MHGTVAHFLMMVLYFVANIRNRKMLLLPPTQNIIIWIKLINSSSRLNPTERIYFQHMHGGQLHKVHQTDTSCDLDNYLNPMKLASNFPVE